ncbi:lipopolysaccharide assembly protein LapA domain-containing protein [Gemmobacter nectariphilus]|uniref:lipopolysaccharide assembly protein LapA domain-containing protein n=1 Tax=Gemmobacter nectariphilus TaxID=220343 RepID=UPI00042321CD
MMKYLRYLVLLLIAVGLVAVALANREVVALHMLPPDLAQLVGIDWTIRLPLFLVGFGGVVVGVLIGFVWEWLREHKHRAAAAAKAREVQQLKREVAQATPPAPKDDVLALLDAPPRKAG